MKIAFWPTKREGFFVSHGQGLSQLQIDELKKLKVGDRLKLWANNLPGDNQSAFSLQEFVETEKR
jgi:hypothetical protein